MKLNKEQAKNKVVDTILNGTRHYDYERTVEIADLNRDMITGNVASRLVQFNPRESKPAFEQRVRLTKSITPAMAYSIMTAFYKVPRTDRVVKKILPKKGVSETSVSAIVEEIQQKMDLFYGSNNEEGGLDFWLKNRFIELSFIDPNTFIVIEFDDFDPLTEKPTAYPYEVNSEMAINFEIENNNVDWLIVEEATKFLKGAVKKDPKDKQFSKEYEDGHNYTMYCGDFNYKLRQVSTDNSVRKFDPIGEGETLITIGDKTFAMSVYDTLLKDWQMFRVGYFRDIETDGRTFVTPLHPAMCYFESSVKDVSEFQLTKATHVFPQKVSYVMACNGEVTREEDGTYNMQSCNKGRTIAGKICGACQGSGVAVHKTAQDVITIPLPEYKDEMFKLSEMMHYFAPPIELLKFQDEQVDKYEPKIHQAIFNTTVLVKKTTVATATEKDQDMDNVYNTLSMFANKSASVYLNVANAIAYLLDYTDVTFVFRYPSDFKMKTKGALYDEIEKINTSGAPAFVKESVEDDLADQVYVDDPQGLIEYKVKKMFLPFQGLTQDQIALALMSTLTRDADKVLYLNFTAIMSEASRGTKNFFIQKYEAQKSKIDEIVARYISELTPTTPKLPIIE